MSGLDGSTSDNPWVFKDDGSFVRLLTGQRLVIFKGPSLDEPPPCAPFTNAQNSPRTRRVKERAIGPERASTSISGAGRQTARISTGGRRSAARVQPAFDPARTPPRNLTLFHTVYPSTSSAATRLVRRQPVVGPIVDGYHAVGGSRADRGDNDLTEGQLWLGDARPPGIKNPQVHHICAICNCLKSHPVSVPCGHSYCYVCLRLWLEKSWCCPQCGAFVTAPPFRHCGEESSIRVEHPLWNDESGVDYSWDGLVFTRKRAVVRVDTPSP
ncbi:hypothetical protein C8F04DRAFT_1264317 [Mycena alexandri]|uniref:RING-type domain-containing protein n=1 Tax=Mycena alexandri TaxID=1745969 RepID=A0AAD6X2N6_9AGAR|nr:hypothetical protein C8F04DRAFT_1264317 [Mycena alexandri]